VGCGGGDDCMKKSFIPDSQRVPFKSRPDIRNSLGCDDSHVCDLSALCIMISLEEVVTCSDI